MPKFDFEKLEPENKKPQAINEQGQYEFDFADEPVKAADANKSDRRLDRVSDKPAVTSGQAKEAENDDPFDWIKKEKERQKRLDQERAAAEAQKKNLTEEEQRQKDLEEDREEDREDLANTYRRF
jgi:hypothetical protein